MKRIVIISVILLMTLLYSIDARAIAVDGDFYTTPTEWDGYFVDGDGTLFPGGGGQAFDVEQLGLKFTPGGKLYVGLRTGFDVRTIVGGYSPGDFALDVNTDGVYDFAVDFSFSGNTPTFSLYHVTSWNNVVIPAHNISDPLDYKTGSLLPVFIDEAFGIDGSSYVLEGAFDLSALEYGGLYTGGDIALHWTMSCGNDFLDITTSPIPEPSTYLLLGSGIVGLVFWRRRRGAK